MPRKSVVAALLLFTPLSLCAFRARPLSDLAFESRVAAMSDSVASDGTDFLVVWLGYAKGGIYGQVVSRGGTRGPAFFIGAGSTAPSVIWTGAKYLVARGAVVTSVSRSGAVLASSGPLLSDPSMVTKLTAGRSNVLLTGASRNFDAIEARLLDFDGHPKGGEIPISVQGFVYSIAATSYGFALGAVGSSATVVARIGADGATLGLTTVDGPYTGSIPGVAVSLASDGSETMIALGESSVFRRPALRTAIVRSDGSIRRATTKAFEFTGSTVQPLQSFWSGTEYVTLANILNFSPILQPFPFEIGVDSAIVHTTRDGALIGTPATLGASRQAIASNGREYLVALDGIAEVVPVGNVGGETSFDLGRIVNAQTSPAVAASRSQSLAAWIEGSDVRASRLDAEGNYLDGRGIVLGSLTVPAYTRRTAPTVAVDSDGRDWFVVWADSNVRGMHVSGEGALLDPKPINLSAGDEATVRWGGGEYVVFTVAGRRLLTFHLGPYGPVIGLQIDSPSQTFDSPVLVFDGRGFLALAAERNATCDGLGTSCARPPNVISLRLDAIGTTLDPVPVVVAAGEHPAAATDGQRYAIAWQDDDTVSVLVTPWLVPVLRQTSSSRPALTFDGTDFLLASETSGRLRIARLNGPSVDLDGVGASFTRGLLVFSQQLDANEGAPRGAALRLPEIAPLLVAPAAPSVVTAARLGRDTIDVSWQPVAGALGVAIELRLPDGTYRQAGNAAGGAARAVIDTAGLPGTAVRLRAWNGAGMSAPAGDAFIAGGRVRAARPD